MERTRITIDLVRHPPAAPFKEKDVSLIRDDESNCSSMSPSTCSSNSSSSGSAFEICSPQFEPPKNEVRSTVIVSGPKATSRRKYTESDDDFLECLEAEVKEMAADDESDVLPHQFQHPQRQRELESPPTLSSGIGERDKDWKIPRKVITESYEQKTGGSPKRKKGDSNLEDEKLVKIKKPKDSIASPQPQQFTYEDKADGAKLVIDVLMPYLRNKVIENENEFKWLAKKLTHKALKKGFARDKAKIEKYVSNKFRRAGMQPPDIMNPES